jgi:site-specific DNA recombinase
LGGAPPLGYTPQDRTLLIDQREAPLVCSIFRRYLETGSVHVLARQLREEGVRSRCWTTAKGERRGGAILSRGKLYHLLRNPVYIGEIRHRDKVYPGLHEAIVDRETFDAVQAKLDQSIRRRKSTIRESAPLLGLLFDAAGHRMSPVHSRGRSGRRYRYYNSAPLQSGLPADASSRRIPAEPIEELLLDRFRTWSGETTAGWERFAPLVKRIEVHPRAVVVTFEPPANARWREHIATRDEVLSMSDGMLRVTIASAVRTRGGRSSVMTDTANRPRPDRTLIQALRSAHRILGEHGIDILSRAPKLDAARGIDDPWNRRIVRLAFLAPDIQHAILTGRQPLGLTLADLAGDGVPLGWDMQRETFGFASHGRA